MFYLQMISVMAQVLAQLLLHTSVLAVGSET